MACSTTFLKTTSTVTPGTSSPKSLSIPTVKTSSSTWAFPSSTEDAATMPASSLSMVRCLPSAPSSIYAMMATFERCATFRPGRDSASKTIVSLMQFPRFPGISSGLELARWPLRPEMHHLRQKPARNCGHQTRHMHCTLWPALKLCSTPAAVITSFASWTHAST